MPWILILVLALFQCTLTNYLIVNPDYYQLGPYTWESSAFRSMQVCSRLLWDKNPQRGSGALDFDQITTLMIEHDYDTRSLTQTLYSNTLLAAARPADYRKLRKAYETVLGDLSYFPVPASSAGDTPDVTLQNNWQDKSHEGCDIEGTARPPGFYPVVSISDGVVESLGWLEMEGWQLRIRAPGGACLSYAHLYGYAEGLREGDTVKAGQLLGYMGDTGYGTAPGTTGNFDVHLHVELRLKTDHFKELSVNPYWILKGLLSRRQVFAY